MLNRLLLFVVLALSLLFAVGCRNDVEASDSSAALPATGVQSGSLQHDELERTYLFYLPSTYDADTPLPLVLALHGGEGSGRSMMQGTGFNTLAEQEGFIVVYPDGVDGWNDGRDVGERQAVDDVGFLVALLDQLVADYAVDPERVFVTGGSNGGMMSFRLACEQSERFAGVATAIANMGVELAESCAPTQPIPILMMMGTADPLMPFEGGTVGAGASQRGEVISAAVTLDFWRTHNGCSDSVTPTALPDTMPEDGTRVYLESYTDCAEGGRVDWYRMVRQEVARVIVWHGTGRDPTWCPITSTLGGEAGR